MTIILLREGWTPWCSSLWRFLHFTFTSCNFITKGVPSPYAQNPPTWSQINAMPDKSLCIWFYFTLPFNFRLTRFRFSHQISAHFPLPKVFSNRTTKYARQNLSYKVTDAQMPCLYEYYRKKPSARIEQHWTLPQALNVITAKEARQDRFGSSSLLSNLLLSVMTERKLC